MSNLKLSNFNIFHILCYFRLECFHFFIFISNLTFSFLSWFHLNFHFIFFIWVDDNLLSRTEQIILQFSVLFSWFNHLKSFSYVSFLPFPFPFPFILLFLFSFTFPSSFSFSFSFSFSYYPNKLFYYFLFFWAFSIFHNFDVFISVFMFLFLLIRRYNTSCCGTRNWKFQLHRCSVYWWKCFAIFILCRIWKKWSW